MKFNGTIIITDPCYIMKEGNVDYSTSPKREDYINEFKSEKTENQTLKERLNSMRNEIKHSETEVYQSQVKLYNEAISKWKESNQRDWEKCDYGDNMEILGIKTYLCSGTGYGDWSCTTYDQDTLEELGEFCADSGMVAVFLLEEVLAYNPEFDYHIAKKHTTTLIENFDGEIEIIDDDTNEGCVCVIGTGNVDFRTSQTGL